MNEQITEYVDSSRANLRVDREAGVVRGVKILGLSSKNNRTYSANALRRAIGLYEGARVNVNHPQGRADAPRAYQDRIGTVRNVSQRDDGLYGDFYFNPKHAVAEQLAWDAQHAPENVGFSHNALARTSTKDGQSIWWPIRQPPADCLNIKSPQLWPALVFGTTDPKRGGR